MKVMQSTARHKWLEISVNVPAHTLSPVAAVFNKYGYGGVITEEWPQDSGEKTFIVKIFLPVVRSVSRRKSELVAKLKGLGVPVNLEEKILEPGEWLNEWKKYFDAFEIGEKSIIKPSWQSKLPVTSEKVVLELDPGMAFGTGLHATTRLTYIELEKYIKPGMEVLDLGTGSGILAIAAAKLGAGSVLAIDNDSVAVEAAKLNVERNCVSNVVQVKKGTLNRTSSRRFKGRFDLIVANITASVISSLAAYFAVILKQESILIASGINDGGLDEVLIKLSLSGLTVKEIKSDGEWHAVVATKE